MMNILVIAAHPDDEVLGCGGTMAKLAAEGHTVHSVILGEGVSARYGAGTDTLGERNTLHTSAANAARILGAEKPKIFTFPDNRFDSVPLLDIIKEVEAAIAHWKPEMIFTQHGGDLNIDHVQTFRAVMAATRPMEGCGIKSVMSFEVNSATEWSFQKFSPVFRPSVFVDIGKTLPKKIKALQAYASEMRPFPHPRSLEAVRAQAVRWGSVAGVKAAEAFEVIWEVR